MFAQLTSFTMLLSLQNSFASLKLHTTLLKTRVTLVAISVGWHYTALPSRMSSLLSNEYHSRLFPVDEFKDITNGSRTSSTHHNSESELLLMMCDTLYKIVYPDWLTSWKTVLTVSILIVLLAVVWV